METYPISNRKEFMNKLLKSELFDTFEVKEIVIHAAFKLVIDGNRNMDYFDTLNDETYSKLLTWGEVRKHVYELMQGTKMPTYFKIILGTNKEKTASLSPEASAFCLNIHFKENQISCSTGTSYKTFTLDKSADTLWDEKMKQFLFKYQFM